MATERDQKTRQVSDDPVVNRKQGTSDKLPTPDRVKLKHSSTKQGHGPSEVKYNKDGE